MRMITRVSLALALLTMNSIALAHPGHESTGLAAGILHPFTGLDHLLAMLAVGLWAAQQGGRALWQIPSAFVTLLALGGVLGMNGLALPGVEWGVASSVLLFGALIVGGARLPVSAGMALAGAFALCHGVAHGAEIPQGSSEITYVLGFILASLSLHILGLLTVSATQLTSVVTRFMGAAIATAGAFLLVSV